MDFPRDSKDAKFIACALASEADFLITGDRDFTEVEDLGKTLSLAGAVSTENKESITVSLPRNQLFSSNSLELIMQKVLKGEGL